MKTTENGTCACCKKTAIVSPCWHYDGAKLPVCDNCADQAINEAELEI